MVWLIVSQISKLVWFQYNSTGCLTCHSTPILRMNDSIFILGSLHTGLRPMLMGIKVKQGITVEWYKAFNPNISLSLDVSDIKKVNDTLIAVSGGHGGCGYNTSCSFVGLFNLKTKNFVWAKYFSQKAIARGLAFDGSNLVVAIQGYDASNVGAIVKMDLSGNVIWAKTTSFGCSNNDNYSIIPEGNSYVVMGIGWWCGNWQPVIYRISSDGNSVTLIRGISNNYRAYRLIRDSDGNYVIIGFYEPNYRAYLAKISPNGQIVYSKQYSANSDLRFYDITLDIDGNYLVSGSTTLGLTTYPIAAKINKNDGSIIYARMWQGAPSNQSNNQAKGISPISPGKILISGYLGTGVDNHNGFVVILDSIDCLVNLSVSVSDFSLGNWYPNITLSSYSGTNNLNLSAYNFTLSQTTSCTISPVGDNEFESCNYRIYGGKGFIKISSNKEL
ncbi:MAG: hypothetical protein ABIL37_05225, partial [candidate division WOR-3 bacterium]